MQIPIISGIYTGDAGSLHRSYPFNLIAVPVDSGFSQGFLRQHEGARKLTLGSGPDRGGYEWRGNHYRVQGTSFISVAADGTWTLIGDVGAGGWCQFAHSFDHMAIQSGTSIFLYDGTNLTQITDVDLGPSYSVTWIDGYFVSTDKTSIIVTELTNPFAVDPLKYGSSEANPDEIKLLLRVRNELAAVNRYTIEMFSNVGGTNFPFSRVNGATATKGAVSNRAAVAYEGEIFFCGSGQGEAISFYSARDGIVQKLATQEIDVILSKYTKADLDKVIVEQRVVDAHHFIYVHLPDKTLLFDNSASMDLKNRIWTVLGEGPNANESTKFQARGFVLAHEKWFCGHYDLGMIGQLDYAEKSQFGNVFSWDFQTFVTFASAQDFLVRSIEIFGGVGFATAGQQIAIEQSKDGLNWNMPRYAKIPSGFPAKRIQIRNLGRAKNQLVLRVSGSSESLLSIARLELTPEILK